MAFTCRLRSLQQTRTAALLFLVAAVATTVAAETATAATQTPTAAAVARLVDAHYNRLQSLRARYTERYRGMGVDRSETGTLTLRKPGRMRWAYDTPAGKLFVVDGHSAVSYTPGDAEAQSLPVSKLDDLHSPLRFLLGHTQLTRELDGLSLAPVAGGYTLSGTPKGMANRVRTILLTVDGTGQIHQLRILEPDNSETTFDFTDIHENVPTDDAEFHFNPPPGVTVVQGQAPI